MWRRVSCEQQLHSSQSILSTRGNPMLMVKNLFQFTTLSFVRKGIWFIFQNLVPETLKKSFLWVFGPVNSSG